MEAVFKEHHNWMTHGLLTRLHDLGTADHTLALMAERLAKLQCDRDATLHDPSATGPTSSLKDLLSKTVDTLLKRQDQMQIRQQRLTAVTASIEQCQHDITVKRHTYRQMHACIEAECKHVVGSFERDAYMALAECCRLFMAYHHE